ncbi:putative PurR-regulated permease PerM [Bradyrhizobium elkanii]|uniref:hypothetical protein n=1 Tax=Bradyrhizobium TaxID=374 RepID=UPI0021677CEE|nr:MULTISPECIES: hypothetical protein [Bradyrhizobium]MCS3928956.1 putative PurR-regulated permease PerM [Bradyrhizobium elkanii]MCS3969512.1 putative PurR-regulated permease PerM [Bradyrhizobium japonicum]
MLIALSLMLRDGTWLGDRAVATARRLLGDPGIHLIGRIADATRATMSGTTAATIVRAAVIAVAYLLMGVPHPLLFSVLTMVWRWCRSAPGLRLRRLRAYIGGSAELLFC